MNIDSTLRQIREQNFRLAQAEDRLTELESRAVTEFCPVQIGETVSVSVGYPHAGKQMIVTHRSLRLRHGHGGKPYSWLLTGPVLNLDGSRSRRYGEHSRKI